MHISPDSILVLAIGVGVPVLLSLVSRVYNRMMLRQAGYIAAMPDELR